MTDKRSEEARTDPPQTEQADAPAPGGILNKAVAQNMALVAVSKAVAMAAGLAVTMLLTRHLGPEDYGRYREVLNYVALAAVLADLGLYMVVLRELPKPGPHDRLLGAAMALRLLATGVILGLAALAGLFVLDDPAVRTGMFVGALYYVVYQSTELLVAVFQRHLRQDRQALAEMTGSAALLGLTALGVVLDGGPVAMLAMLAGSATVTLLLAWRWARRLQPFALRADPGQWRWLAVTGLPFAGSRMLAILMLRTDMFVLAVTHPARAVGLYGVPTKVFELVTSIPALFGGLVMATFVRAFVAGDRRSLDRSVGEAILAILWFGVGVTAATAVFAEDIVVLIGGPGFADAGPIMALLGPAMGLAGVSYVLRFSLSAMELQGRLLRLDVLVTLCAFCAFWLLIPPFAERGAAVARLLMEALMLAGLAWIARASGLRPRIARQALLCLLAGAAGGAAMAAIAGATGAWWAGLLLGGLFYTVLSILFGVLPRRRIAAELRRRLGR